MSFYAACFRVNVSLMLALILHSIEIDSHMMYISRRFHVASTSDARRGYLCAA